jgi:hypothetical protein
MAVFLLNGQGQPGKNIYIQHVDYGAPAMTRAKGVSPFLGSLIYNAENIIEIAPYGHVPAEAPQIADKSARTPLRSCSDRASVPAPLANEAFGMR